MTKDEIEQVVRLHAAWLHGEEAGRRANLGEANLSGANLRGADLRNARMPDGRTLDEWRADPLAGICDAPEVRQRAQQATGHTWRDCPMHAALGIDGFDDVSDDQKRLLVAAFVALYDGGHLADGWRDVGTTDEARGDAP